MKPWGEVEGKVLQPEGLGEPRPLHLRGPGVERKGLLGDDLEPLLLRGLTWSLGTPGEGASESSAVPRPPSWYCACRPGGAQESRLALAGCM